MIYLWLIILALLVTALFSAAEMSFIAANRLRLRHLAEAGNRHAARYLESFKQPERLLSTAMMGVTIAHITASAVATWWLVEEVGQAAALVATLVLTPLMLVFGEVIPKAVARERATSPLLRLLPHPDLRRPDLQCRGGGHGHGPLAPRRDGAGCACAHAPGHLRPRDQAHRRPPARAAEGPRPARGGRRRVRRRGGHRHRGGHRRADRRGDPGRARSDAGHRRA